MTRHNCITCRHISDSSHSTQQQQPPSIQWVTRLICISLIHMSHWRKVFWGSSEFSYNGIEDTWVGIDYWRITNLFWSKKMSTSNTHNQKKFSINFTEARRNLFSPIPQWLFVTISSDQETRGNYFFFPWLTGPPPPPSLGITEEGAISMSAHAITLASNVLHAQPWACWRDLCKG